MSDWLIEAEVISGVKRSRDLKLNVATARGIPFTSVGRGSSATPTRQRRPSIPATAHPSVCQMWNICPHHGVTCPRKSVAALTLTNLTLNPYRYLTYNNPVQCRGELTNASALPLRQHSDPVHKPEFFHYFCAKQYAFRSRR